MTFIDFEVQRKKHQRRHLLLRDWGHQPSISGPDFPGRQAIPVAPTPPGTPLGLVGAIGHPAVRGRASARLTSYQQAQTRLPGGITAGMIARVFGARV